MKKICLMVVAVMMMVSGLSAQETAPSPPPSPPPEETETRPEETRPSVETQPEAKTEETRPSGETQPAVSERVPPMTGEYKKTPYATGSACEAEPAGVKAVGYTLRLAFMEGGSESVCDVELKVKNVKGKELFKGKVSSPWIYLDLPPGGYLVSAKKTGEVIKIITTQTSSGKLQRARIFFTAQGEIPLSP